MYFSQHGIRCYALPLHVHGNSWYPSFLRMLYWTTKRCLQMAWLQELESEKRGEKVEAVLVGHSNGGGLSQSILSEGDVKTKALVLVETIPCFGS